ncbi:MAG: histidine phosphatase family protein [Proteobacteria bacterium]|nr:histidine phosphatase family protein [Pseudomonadota bacterium]
MNSPSITRRRRPFMAPVWLLGMLAAGVLLLLAGSLLYFQRATVTTVIVVRHAEKAAVEGTDPPLSPLGVERAQRLAALFGGGTKLGADTALGRPVAIYVSDTRRSQQTAAPLAERLGVVPVVADSDPGALAERIEAEHHGEMVLVVGHSNTVPAIVSRVSGLAAVPPMTDDEYGTVYIVSLPSLGKAAILRLDF